MKVVDLRSDTVTLPSEEMRRAIYEAELGDDVFGEDPTTNRLEAMAAEMLGKEAALLVTSGTMGNLVSVLGHCDRGDEVILGDQADMFLYECGSMSAVGGVHPHTVAKREDGTLDLGEIEGAIRRGNVHMTMHFPRSRLVCLENTHNRCRGAVLGLDYIGAVAQLAKEHGLALHMDGARVFNASIALGVDVKEVVREADSVSICLSKGLGAPVGSIVCGREDFILRARRARKSVGGGMRQCGIIAAAGIYSLENMVERLAEDHANARRLAEGLAEIDGLEVELESVHTNMVYMRLVSEDLEPGELVERCGAEGVRFLNLKSNVFRMVTHFGAEEEDIDRAVEVIAAGMKA
jgi:threonine aldolase